MKNGLNSTIPPVVARRQTKFRRERELTERAEMEPYRCDGGGLVAARSSSCIWFQTPATAAPVPETAAAVLELCPRTWQMHPSEYSPIATIPTRSIAQASHCCWHP